MVVGWWVGGGGVELSQILVIVAVQAWGDAARRQSCKQHKQAGQTARRAEACQCASCQLGRCRPDPEGWKTIKQSLALPLNDTAMLALMKLQFVCVFAYVFTQWLLCCDFPQKSKWLNFYLFVCLLIFLEGIAWVKKQQQITILWNACGFRSDLECLFASFNLLYLSVITGLQYFLCRITVPIQD